MDKKNPRIIFGGGTKVLRAVNRIIDEGFAKPIPSRPPEIIHKLAKELPVSTNPAATIINHLEPSPRRTNTYSFCFKSAPVAGDAARSAKAHARLELLRGDRRGLGDADGMVTGANVKYRDAVRYPSGHWSRAEKPPPATSC